MVLCAQTRRVGRKETCLPLCKLNFVGALNVKYTSGVLTHASDAVLSTYKMAAYMHAGPHNSASAPSSSYI